MNFTVSRKHRQRFSVEKSVFTAVYEILRSLLRELREAANVTQIDLAARLDETQSYISKCERGERRLDLIQLQAFCAALKHPLMDFVAEYVRRTRKAATQSTSSSRVPSTRATRE